MSSGPVDSTADRAPAPSGHSHRRFGVALAAIALLGLGLRLWDLPGQRIFADDACVGVSATNFVQRGLLGPTMWHHPHLRDLLVYTSVQALGDSKIGLTIFSLVFGAISVPLLGLVALRLLGRRDVALLASALLAIDSLHIDYSRQGVHEDYMLFFTLAGLWLALEFARRDRPGWLLGAGTAFGLGLASKWYPAFPLAVIAAALAARVVRGHLARREALQRLAFLFAALVLLPLAIYLATFYPWFQRGHGLAEWADLHWRMLHEAQTHRGYNPYLPTIDHRAYLWFLRPVYYIDVGFGPGDPVLLIAITNPFVWLLTWPAIAYLAHRARKDGLESQWLLLALFGASYLPFLLLPERRPIWAHTAFAVLPFALVAVAYLLAEVSAGVRRRRKLLVAYLVTAAACAAPLYLLAIGKGLDVAPLRPIVEMFRPAEERPEPSE